RLPPAEPAKNVPKEIKIEIESAHDGADQVFGLLEPLEPADQPVADRVVLQVEQRGDHRSVQGGSTGGTAGALVPESLVARKKISSRLVSPGCSENFRVTSSSVPSMIFRPFFKIRRREQISSTRCSR